MTGGFVYTHENYLVGAGEEENKGEFCNEYRMDSEICRRIGNAVNSGVYSRVCR